MMHFVDTETTGLDNRRHEVIELAILTDYPNGKKERWVSKIKPLHIDTADPKALEINGYSEEEWESAPYFAEVYEEVQKRLRVGLIVGHNIQFDMNFIKEHFKRMGKDPDKYYPSSVPAHSRVEGVSRRWIDTQVLAHEHLTPMGLSGLGLDAIRRFMGWDTEGAHRAEQDAEDTRALYYSLIRRSWRVP